MCACGPLDGVLVLPRARGLDIALGRAQVSAPNASIVALEDATPPLTVHSCTSEEKPGTVRAAKTPREPRRQVASRGQGSGVKVQGQSPGHRPSSRPRMA